MSIKIAKTELLDEYVLDDPISDEIVGTSRWSVQHEVIFKWKDGKNYKTHYSVGATEQQDESPWEYETEVNCVEVEQQQVTVTKWVEKVA